MSIPEEVLDKIVIHRPFLAKLVENYRAADGRLKLILGKRLADAYLRGETRLSAMETLNLARCCVPGRDYAEAE